MKVIIFLYVWDIFHNFRSMITFENSESELISYQKILKAVKSLINIF